MTGTKFLAGGGLTAAAGNAGLIWTDFDLGSLLSGISLAAVTIAGVYATVYGIYTQARIKAKKDFDEANKGSMTEQVAEMTANLAKMRESLHTLRNQASEERLKHAEESERLLLQLNALQESFTHASDENRSLRNEIRSLRDEVDRLEDHIDELTRGVARVEQATGNGSGDNLPQHP